MLSNSIVNFFWSNVRAMLSFIVRGLPSATDLFTFQTACCTAGKSVSGFSGAVRTAMKSDGHIPWPSGW